MNFPPVLFHPINTITAYKGQIIYDTPATEAKAQTPVPYLQWEPAPGVTPPSSRPTNLADLVVAAAGRGGPDLAGTAPGVGSGPPPGPPTRDAALPKQSAGRGS